MSVVTPRRFAAGTKVPIAKTKTELDELLQKHGATQRYTGHDDARNVAVVGFTIAVGKSSRQVRIVVPMPAKERLRSTAAADARHLQACKERWRGALLLVKAKLEAVATGMSTIEREFLADVTLPDGRTVHQAIAEHVASSYETGQPVGLLGPGGGAR
jgi:hypothetical protein